MNNDFETHPIGTLKEIQLSRALAMAIENELAVSPFSEKIMSAYTQLKKHYAWQIENEESWRL